MPKNFFGIGLRIQKTINEQNLSQKDLALKLGVGEPSVSRWVNQGVVPNKSTRKRISAVLGVSLNWLETGHGRAVPDHILPAPPGVAAANQEQDKALYLNQRQQLIEQCQLLLRIVQDTISRL